MHKKKQIRNSDIINVIINFACIVLMVLALIPSMKFDYTVSIFDVIVLLFSSCLTIWLAIYVVRKVEWNVTNRRTDNEIIASMLKEILPVCSELKEFAHERKDIYDDIPPLCKQLTVILSNVRELSQALKGKIGEEHEKLFATIKKTRNDMTSISGDRESLNFLIVEEGKVRFGRSKLQQIQKDIENIRILTHKYWAEIYKM